jgi:DNA-directed RNA polymerase specialized sigma24 family protein
VAAIITPTSGKETAMSNEVVAVGVDGCPADDPSARRRRAEAMRRLPPAYSLALRLRDAGLADELIAECLAMQREALDPLLQVAEAKLASILGREPGG